MKALISLFAVTLIPASAVADDLADARTAFAMMREYQKKDDERSPDLFAKDCAVTFTFTDGKREKSAAMPTEKFIEMLKAQIAKKEGNSETYEEVKFSQESTGVRVTALVRSPTSGRTAPYSALYRRSGDGVLRIHELKVTMYVNE